MIDIQHLVKAYGVKKAVDDISFSVKSGEIVGFLGPNGAGKSTTMNILTGYLSATEGQVRIGGYDILEDPANAKKQIGYLPEQPPLYPDMTVKEYLSFVYDLKKCRFDRKKHIDEICQVVGIADVAHRPIKFLSKGYRQRVGIAQSLVGDPPVLIFDEPTVGLDPKQIIDIRNLIRDLGKTHTVILSTHILPEVQAVCDRIVIINKGRLIADKQTAEIDTILTGSRRYAVDVAGNKDAIYTALSETQGVRTVTYDSQSEEGVHRFVLDAQAGVDVRKPLFFALADKALPIMHLTTVNKNLEDVFIELTR